MENQHRKISEYRDLSKKEIDLMNAIKAKGAEIDALIKGIDAHILEQRADAQRSACAGIQQDEEVRLALAEPERWLAISRTHIQQGFMAMIRSVAQPTTPC